MIVPFVAEDWVAQSFEEGQVESPAALLSSAI